MNSVNQRDDDRYRRAARLLASALGDVLAVERYSKKVRRLPEWTDMKILDHGFGTARLLCGLELLDRLPHRYFGLDVQPQLVEWGRAALQPTGFCDFELVDMHNRRYNRDGTRQPVEIVPDRFTGVDLIVSRSIFTHMTAPDIRLCLGEFQRALAQGGRVYVTVNVKNGVPAWVDNPEKPDAPPLLKTELNKSYFEYMVEDAGFRTSVFVESIENQCVYVLRKE
ncbi:class I SAM-dependent methyltransferase [Euzebya tangerina]|uniref:class I SAM-dependent methyltransferase n=1 Tax=Euzebya tangerina TaxID=591198 RepID=UPI0013C2FB1D|nr:class I SAM-dependent methyltransferase [Euzebya tangerina]